MARSSKDMALGLATLVVLTTVISLAAGLAGLLYIGLFTEIGRITIRLWESPLRLSKVLAACLVPALLWSHLMSKGIRRRIMGFEAVYVKKHQ